MGSTANQSEFDINNLATSLNGKADRDGTNMINQLSSAAQVYFAGLAGGGGGSRNIGEIVASTIPLTDSGLHLLDGAVIDYGAYKAFVDYMYNFYGNIIPTNITPTNAQGFLCSDSDQSEVYLALNPYAWSSESYYPRCQWRVNASESHPWLQVLFPSAVDIAQYTVMNYADSNLTGRIVTEWSLEYTTDSGATWVQADYVSGVPQTQGLITTRTLSNVLHNVDGIRITALNGGSGGYSSMGSIRFYNNTKSSALFVDEHDWEQAVTTYGVCGKFIYDYTNKTIRLPKITGFVEGTTDLAALGDLVEAGLPSINHTHKLYVYGESGQGNGGLENVLTSDRPSTQGYMNTRNYAGEFLTPPNSIYGNSDTVQPQAIKVLYYICIATSSRIDVQIDIDQIATDLNGKVSVADMQEVQCVVETYANGVSWYRIWSDGWCEQGGQYLNNETSITFLKPYIDTNYKIFTSCTDSNPNDGAYASCWTNKTVNGFKGWITYGTSLGSNVPTDWYTCGYIR